MKFKVHLSLLVVLLVILALFLQGCEKQPEINNQVSNLENEDTEQTNINMNDLSMVNEYIKQAGANEIPVEALEGLTNVLFKNTGTNEIKTNWQLVVDFVRNEISEEKQDLDYSIVFEDSSFSLEDNENWKCIGVEEDGEA